MCAVVVGRPGGGGGGGFSALVHANKTLDVAETTTCVALLLSLFSA